ncbi:MAG TPA: tetratricopeptide repeat protein [Pyrinomonadaceae bacterium]|jgi:Flp pilus assembly protein TadD|nr:tetratricopeptide repeat protein [Pyrinomonadaceae bacterium]
MFRNSAIVHASVLLTFALSSSVHAQVQNSIALAQPRNSVSVLDSTKEQDGLIGSVRKVRTESAKVETKEGQLSEGPLQLVELTTYGIKGNRIENVSYPGADPQIGNQEYKYDSRGNITEMTMRDERGAVVSRESYSYEFDTVGNWIKMTTSLILFENGKVKREPVETTYRTISYYFTDDVAKIYESPAPKVVPLPLPTTELLANLDGLKPGMSLTPHANVVLAADSIGEPPAPEVRPSDPVNPDTNVATTTSVGPVPNTNPVSNTKRLSVQSDEETTKTGTGSRLLNLRKGAESVTPETSARHSPISNTPTGREAAESVAVKTSPAEDSPQGIAFSLYEKGLTYFEKGDYQGAIGAFLVSVKFAPSAEVYLSLGNTYLKQEKNSDAVKAFKESVKLNSDAAEAQYGLGLASFRLRRYMDAKDAFKKATALQPAMTKAHYGLGLAYLELGQADAATTEVRVLETLDKNLARQLAAASPSRSYTCRFSVCQ